ncbi:putative calcium-binding outer membrane-like protein [Psychrobacter sp. JCM 18901]|uniref:hypothetical protein n=1 Tax=Psychrobacter sp. JCM 18901 TaxID=1298609 RepID=UPI00043217AB|nr:hypothetical protein [Psychrobacter sp. JCM 18901]GAF54969.1 putative calcium-binding outer membrane-like protein [Psychrobacter sp. JCM 18901]
MLTAKAVEASGASSSISSSAIKISSELAKSDIKLTSISSPKVVTVTDKQFTIQVSAKRPNGNVAVGQKVKLEISDVAGVSIQGNEQTTNEAGNAVFTVNLSQDLTPVQRTALITSGIKYNVTLTDDDGTVAKITDAVVKVVQPATSLEFASIITPSISELGGKGTISIKLLTKENQTPVKGQEVTIQLGQAAIASRVTVNQTTATTDFSGETTFIVTIPEGLTAEERNELKRTGINYQLSYVEKGETYTSAITKVDILTPTVDLTVLNPPNLINNRPFYTLNGEGDTVTVNAALSTRNTNLSISDQPIKLDFANKELAALLIVNGKSGSFANIVPTDPNGAASFTVTVPSLTAEQQAALLDQKLTAILTETLTGKKQEIQFNIQSTKAAIDLIAITPKALNLNGGETQVEVITKDSKDNVIANKQVYLALPASVAAQGVSLVTSGTQTTNDSGKASFTLAVPAGLTNAQKSAIGSSFKVVFSATDENDNIATKISTVKTLTPDPSGTSESLAIGANKVVNTKGDTFKVFVRVANNIKGNADNADKTIGIANRKVELYVDDFLQTGVTISNNIVTTNGDGVATFDLTLENGASVNQAVLEKNGIQLTAKTTTAENVELEQKYTVAVDTSTIESYQLIASSDKPTLTTGGDQTQASFIVTDDNGGILTGVPVQLSIENLESSGAALTTSSTVVSDSNGRVDVGVLLAANSINARLNHSVVINAKIVTPQYDVDGNVSMQVREEKSLSLSAIGTEITIVATEANLKDGASTTITTTLVDGAGRAIANANMELVARTVMLLPLALRQLLMQMVMPVLMSVKVIYSSITMVTYVYLLVLWVKTASILSAV